MLTVADALKLVLEHATPLPPQPVARDEALGLVLAEDIASDVDSPPHDKSLVDGYAVVAADLASGAAKLSILEEVVAGKVPTQRVVPGTATRIMTGAPLPEGADAVVMVERTELHPGGGTGLGQVSVVQERVKPGQNIMRRAASLKRGQAVLAAGHLLRPIEVGLLAEVGCATVKVIPCPTLAVLSTGDELVPSDQTPGPGQIRNSNESLLVACAQRAGATPRGLGIGCDNRDDLRRLISDGLRSDLLVLSGGVSAGVLDLVPSVLAELGVEKVFHKVQLKPGKPLWFGVLRRGANQPATYVFGLPGNPVSSLVCFELFVRPAVARLAGRPAEGLHRATARLVSDYAHRGERPTYHPSIWRQCADSPTVEPLDWAGSSDLAGLVKANALACFPAGDQVHPAGSVIDVLLLD